MEAAKIRALDGLRLRWLTSAPVPRSLSEFVGRRLFRLLLTVEGIAAFALITGATMIKKFGVGRAVIRPLIRRESARAGVRLLPMFFFLALLLGFAVIGQTVSWLSQLGSTEYLGRVMVVVVVRELGPLLTALLVLLRCGTAHVIELGTARALGEVEALEAVGIDPIHYLVVPRVIGMALGVFSLTVFLIISSLISGYFWAFLQDIPLPPGDYFRQLAVALGPLDFLVVALKSACFGALIAAITCYHGLAQPLRLEQVSAATISALVQSLIACVVIDSFFILLYLLV